MGLLVAIEGIDGSGKGTQAQRLREALVAEGRAVALLTFPRYEETTFGRAIGDYLNGRFGDLASVSPYLAALLFAGDRFESRGLLAEAIAEHDVVVLDRYVASNVAHQGAKLAPAERPALATWIRDLEYGVYGLPRADLVVLLDLPVPAAQRQIAAKAARTYTDRAADLHEADARYLEACRGAYRDLASAEEEWRIVECAPDGERVRSVEEIGSEVLQLVRDRIAPGATPRQP